MANIHELFTSFNDSITLSDAKTSSLRTSRDSLRKVIKQWFSDNNKQEPKFCWQGSFAMKTTVNPVNGGEYDIDDGVYCPAILISILPNGLPRPLCIIG